MMADEFVAALDPAPAALASGTAGEPRNPFCTAAYAAAMRALGWRPAMLGVARDGGTRSACAAFLSGPALFRTLNIPSLPATAGGVPAFWTGLLEWCQATDVLKVSIDTFATCAAAPLELPGTSARRDRCEYVMDLAGERRAPRWTWHAEHLERARGAALSIRQARDRRQCAAHAAGARATQAAATSLATPDPRWISARAVEALIASGAGDLYQVADGAGRVLASAFVLLSERGAYLHSLAAPSAARPSGAAHWLLWEIGGSLRSRGIDVFNLGEADEANAWLETLKAGFATTRLRSSAVVVTRGSGLRRKLGSALRSLREHPLASATALAGSVERFVAYRADPATVALAQPNGGVRVEKLTNADLARLAADDFAIQVHLDRARRFGFNDAYGTFVDGRLANVSWLVPAEHDRRIGVRNVRVRPGEAEIGPCTTLPEFRGRGVYPIAIGALCREGASLGIRRVFMITGSHNVASRRGIEKAGFARCGSIYRVTLPLTFGRVVVTLRGHRWRDWLARRVATLPLGRR